MIKYICDAMKEGRCKAEVGKCNHRSEHQVLLLDGTFEGSCAIKRFCEWQQGMVRCVEVELFPNMENPITIPEDLAREFVEWVKLGQFCNVSDETLCNKLATRLLEQLKR